MSLSDVKMKIATAVGAECSTGYNPAGVLWTARVGIYSTSGGTEEAVLKDLAALVVQQAGGEAVKAADVASKADAMKAEVDAVVIEKADVGAVAIGATK